MSHARAYYNEIDPFAAQWLRNLIAAGFIADGDVDERSIVDVRPGDLSDYTQCHFFAGIGGWSYALRLAGWRDAEPVWTGSCPCQPLSGAGQRKGHADERHLWPAFYRLIAECSPSVVFGEQVASSDGREWLAGVRADLEVLGYACGAADLCAAGVGAPHPRQRLYWMADAASKRRREARPDQSAQSAQRTGRSSIAISWMGNAASPGLEGKRRFNRTSSERPGGQLGPAMQADVPQWNGPTIAARREDGPVRIPAEPTLFPMAPRIPGDVGRLRGSGNAIVPQVAAEFIRAYLEAA